MEMIVPCFNNFTSMPLLFYNNNDSFSYSNVFLKDCINICSSDVMCSGFNYYDYNSMCYLFNNILYNINNFSTINYENSGFYMKTGQICNTEYDLNPIYLIIPFALLVMCLLSGIICICNKRRRVIYDEERELISEDQIPPPYNGS